VILISQRASQGISRPALYILLVVVSVGGLFLGLRFQIENVSTQFSQSFELEMRATAEEDFLREFVVEVPVAILSMTSEMDQIIITYWALGGLITGDRIVDLSEWRDQFDSIEIRGFFLPGEYSVEVSITDRILRLEFSP